MDAVLDRAEVLKLWDQIEQTVGIILATQRFLLLTSRVRPVLEVVLKRDLDAVRLAVGGVRLAAETVNVLDADLDIVHG